MLAPAHEELHIYDPSISKAYGVKTYLSKTKFSNETNICWQHVSYTQNTSFYTQSYDTVTSTPFCELSTSISKSKELRKDKQLKQFHTTDLKLYVKDYLFYIIGTNILQCHGLSQTPDIPNNSNKISEWKMP